MLRSHGVGVDVASTIACLHSFYRSAATPSKAMEGNSAQTSSDARPLQGPSPDAMNSGNDSAEGTDAASQGTAVAGEGSTATAPSPRPSSYDDDATFDWETHSAVLQAAMECLSQDLGSTAVKGALHASKAPQSSIATALFPRVMSPMPSTYAGKAIEDTGYASVQETRAETAYKEDGFGSCLKMLDLRWWGIVRDKTVHLSSE